MTGLEPARLAALAPKANVYTNFTTSACDSLSANVYTNFTFVRDLSSIPKCRGYVNFCVAYAIIKLMMKGVS